MRDAELLAITAEFRAGILNGESPTMRCFMVSAPLAAYLRMIGVDCETVESDLGEMNHVWIRLSDGRALDPTASQFNTLFPDMGLPDVYLGPPLTIHSERTP